MAEPTLPSFASDEGITERIIFDDFDSNSNIDLNNTQAVDANGRGTFDWYTINFNAWMGDSFPTWTPSPPEHFQVANSILSLQPNNVSHGAQMATAGYRGAATTPRFARRQPYLDGNRPFYVEGRFRWQVEVGQTGFAPAFWLYGIDAYQSSIEDTDFQAGEIDMFESNNGDVIAGAHYWDTALALHGNSNNQTNQAAWNGTDFHTFGVMHLPKAYTDGTTGRLKFYMDRVAYRTDITWTTTNYVRTEETRRYIILVSNNVYVPLEIDYIVAWQHPLTRSVSWAA